jgi:hypothetical protein
MPFLKPGTRPEGVGTERSLKRRARRNPWREAFVLFATY